MGDRPSAPKWYCRTGDQSGIVQQEQGTFLAYKYTVDGKEYGRRQRITKDTYKLFEAAEQPVEATYIANKPATSRLLDYMTTLEARDVIVYLVIFSVGLVVAIFSAT